jgi:hypothetical protein
VAAASMIVQDGSLESRLLLADTITIFPLFTASMLVWHAWSLTQCTLHMIEFRMLTSLATHFENDAEHQTKNTQQ